MRANALSAALLWIALALATGFVFATGARRRVSADYDALGRLLRPSPTVQELNTALVPLAGPVGRTSLAERLDLVPAAPAHPLAWSLSAIPGAQQFVAAWLTDRGPETKAWIAVVSSDDSADVAGPFHIGPSTALRISTILGPAALRIEIEGATRPTWRHTLTHRPSGFTTEELTLLP